jgi:hypothetical protein
MWHAYIGTSYRYEEVTLPEKLMNMEVEQPMTLRG